jgi:hypothetical protein
VAKADTTTAPKQRKTRTPKRSAKVAPKSTAKVKANPSAEETPAPEHAQDRRSDMFGLTADEQRKSSALPLAERRVFVREQLFFRALKIFGDAIERALDQSKIPSKQVRGEIKGKVNDLLHALIKQHGENPMDLPPAKPR